MVALRSHRLRGSADERLRSLGDRPLCPLERGIRNDVLRIEPFFSVAQRVIDIDRKREKSLSYVAVLSAAKIANAKARMAENFLVVAWVQQSLTERAAAYRFALERLIVAVPSPFGIEAERSLTLLQTPIAESALVSPPDFGGVAATAPVPPRRAVVVK